MEVTLASFQLPIPAYIHVERCWQNVEKLSPCEAACPLHMDVPNYIMAISQGSISQALSIIRDSNPLPSVCGRVCHHPCEEECNRKIIDSPVAIEWLKRYSADWGESEKPLPVQPTKKERVAIVGSGPAGLTAAHDLVKKGYHTTIFEASSIAGGILSSAIPDFILPSEAIQADIDYLKTLGVRIHTNVRIGDNIGFNDLRQQGYKAILIATGTQKSAELKIPGANLHGISLSMPFLKEAKLGHLTPFSGKVWVIGGGGVAMDASRTAIRLGADEVHVACLESRRNMPAFDWEIEAAEKEGVHIHPSLAPQEFTSVNGSRITGIKFQRVPSTYLDDEGIHWTLMEGPGGYYTVDTDKVVIAIGQVPETGGTFSKSMKMSKRGEISVNKDTMQTNIRDIFAAGDISATGGTVTEAMAAGRRAALSINQYLSGIPIEPGKETSDTYLIEPEQVPQYFTRKNRWDMPRLLPKEAIRTFKEVDLGYKEWQAIEEAERCLNCRMCGNCIFERHQMCFENAGRLL
jgi:NADPH-dependent glutamate synthase beta subunit-like oxidoreductase